jgi:ribosomal protein S11
MMQTGHRGSAPVSPTNRTGAIYAAQLREKQSRDAAKNEVIDVAKIKAKAFEVGREEGYAKGLGDGWDACIRALVAEGILDPDEPGDEAAV